ncbi:MAG: glycoside hydrolase family 2 TIM barrel-domain containing protein [Planctomycetota bacterium]
MLHRLAALSAFVLAVPLNLSLAGAGETPALHAGDAYVWLEGEKPDSINVKPNIAGWGHKEFLSGETWLHLSFDPDKVEKEVPADGALLAYNFKIEKAGDYEVWDRLGFEFVRSPLDWRIDTAGWQSSGPAVLTRDVMELDFWCEVAWCKLGAAALAAGEHKLEIRLPKTKDEKGKTARILYASDALCIYGGKFCPNGRHKPDEDWRQARDLEAEKNVFALPEAKADGERTSVALAGLWEVCRHDEDLPGPDVAQPIQDFPDKPYWTSIPVPGDKNKLRPDLELCHRLWYRTRVNVPASAAGRSFHIVFPQNNLNTTVVANGVLCGFNKNNFARFAIDVTKGVKPGEVNEIRVGIRDAYYGYATNPKDPMRLRRAFNYPLSVTGRGFQDLAYPVWSHFESGMLVTPEFVMAGPAYTADVFCQPSVARKELALEVTLKRPAGEKLAAEILCEAVNLKTGEVEKAFAPKPFNAAPETDEVLKLAEKWENPKLWWPDEPNMYALRATIKSGAKVLDVSSTPFGFREWTSEGKDFKLNGIVWHGWADCFTAPSPEAWLAFYRKTNQRVMRFWGTSWQDQSPDKALDFFDRSGVVVRRSGILDGEAIGYMAIENDPEMKKESPLKMDLMRNWRDQVVAQILGERNHPSVMVWSIENEYLYINCINLYGGLMDQFEAETTKTSEAVRAVDPTRFTMTDGGGATKANTMPVAGDHYVFDSNSPGKYPDLAYDANPKGGGRGRWEWDLKRPRFIGEDYFATGINPFDYAPFGGEGAFQGKAQAARAGGIIFRMLTEGYRWAGYGAWQFWMGQESGREQYGSNFPVAVFCRQWDWTFGGGSTVKRTVRIFNDSRFDDAITFTWTFKLGGKKIAGETKEYKVTAGTSQELEISLTLPSCRDRTEGELVLSLAHRGTDVFRELKAVSVLPDSKPPLLTALAAFEPWDLLVWDPEGSVTAFLTRMQVPFTKLENLNPETFAAGLPGMLARSKVLLIGKDAVDARDCGSSKFMALAVDGRTVIVLEQKNRLRGQAIPSDLEPQENEGRIAFAEDLDHPAMSGLQQKDFFTWGPDHVVYRNAYVKATRGAKSLVQCHNRLQNTALTEMPVGKGLLILSQLPIGEKINTNAVAQRLLLNLVNYGAQYKLEFRPVVLCQKDADILARELDAIGVKYTKAAAPLEALAAGKVVIIAATPANLAALAGSLDKVQGFMRDGSYLFFNGLTPEGLADYNKIVGVEHLIRPFRMERVTFPAARHPLTAGLTTGDIVMESGKRMFAWTSDTFMASDVFSFVVDYDEVAPFAKFPPAEYFKYTESENDHNPLNMVNGFYSADSWKYIFSIPLDKGAPTEFTISWPKPQELAEFEWAGNAFYYTITKVELFFDGDKANPFVLNTAPNNEVQLFPISPPRQAKDLAIRLAAWNKKEGAAVIGVDNIRIKAARAKEFYKDVKPLLNIGAMMAYSKGSGGAVLCNVLFQERESVPANQAKKRTILATLLRNLKAPFGGEKTIVAGANLQYQPVDISKFCTQFRDDRGWFGDKKFTFKDIPFGPQKFAGVRYEIFEQGTSIVPSVIMLAGGGIPGKLPNEVKGIPVNRKADALFFLHTCRLDQRRNPQELKENKKYEMARYVVTYSDGQTADIPVYAEIDVHEYKQKDPQQISGAQLAWTQAYEGAEFQAVAYSKQWLNPRPDVEIKSIDVLYGTQKRGVPCVLAITAATAPF